MLLPAPADRDALALQSDLPRNAASNYLSSDYVRVSPTGGIGIWTPTNSITYQVPTAFAKLYDLSESFFEVEFNPYVMLTTGGRADVGSKVYLSSMSAMAIDSSFGTSLFSTVGITYAGSQIFTTTGAQQILPYANGVMAVCENESAHTLGTAGYRHWPVLSPDVANPVLLATHATNLTLEIKKQVTGMCKNPFSLSIPGSGNCLAEDTEDTTYPMRTASTTVVTTPTGTADIVALSASEFMDSNHIYRSGLIGREGKYTKSTQFSSVPGTVVATIPIPASVRSMKSLLVAGLDLQISVTRSQDFYPLKGIAGYEYLVNSSDVLPLTGPLNAVFGMDITSMYLYVRIKTPTPELSRLILERSISGRYHQFNKYDALKYDLSSGGVTQQLSFGKRPKVILVSFGLKAINSPTEGTVNFDGVGTPVFTKQWVSTEPILRCGGDASLEVTGLRLDYGGKMYPNYEYNTVVGGSTCIRGANRAYQEFRKALKNPDSISFDQWYQCLRIYAFNLCPDGEDIHDQAFDGSEMQTATITAGLVLPNAIKPGLALNKDFGDYQMNVICVGDQYITTK